MSKDFSGWLGILKPKASKIIPLQKISIALLNPPFEQRGEASLLYLSLKATFLITTLFIAKTTFLIAVGLTVAVDIFSLRSFMSMKK